MTFDALTWFGILIAAVLVPVFLALRNIDG